MEKLAENDPTYFYLRHVVIVLTAVTTISLSPVIYCVMQNTVSTLDELSLNVILWSYYATLCVSFIVFLKDMIMNG